MECSKLYKIKDIDYESIIWFIYYAIITFNLVSNKFEKEFILYDDINAYYKSLCINKIVLTVAFVIYLYFLYTSYKNLKTLKKNASCKKELIANLSFLSSLLFVIGGAIILYVVYNRSYNDEIGL